MRRLSLVLLATLQVCGARSPGFSIHDDLLAFPQYEVVFSDGFISEKDAEALLDGNTQHPAYSADSSQPSAGDARDANAAGGDASTDTPGHAYEVLNMSPHRYLCSMPAIQPPGPENQTANELAKAEEARELSRAATKGWELLTELEESCLYFMSGWWSYSFCNNREIVQFHAVAAVANGQPPRRDPRSPEYVLGRKPSTPATAERHARQDSNAPAPVPAELQVKGDQRYLVQRLDGGTVCDLTGRDRTIEVQYHCVPGMKSDRIGWIKEVTICAYVMVVNTARLCNDVAFLPPDETKANPISCQLIADGNDAARPLLDQGLPAMKDAADITEQAEAGKGKESGKAPEVTVGDVVVGARHVLSSADEDGKPPLKLAPPRSFLAGHQTGDDRLVEVIVQAASKEDGGKVKMLSNEELEKLGIKPEVVREMKQQMEKIAGEAGWKLEIVELDGGHLRELRGYVDEDEEGDEAGQAKEGQAKGKEGQAKGKGEDGSEEKFFKEEL
ncbi:Protein OS-9 [Tolypocladium capitatum]|uniref:Endoplasmic reticulum lectin n=1 Tax=Tolypocladium capitatum TaxID=45235 RepID=A0A2K3QIS4_9HYPO|nr:Protein OS-9 [Tolypocladium capitatum]